MPFQTFFTSDTHFGHKGVLEMSGRPFADIEEHDEMLIAAWNAVVGPRDEVWHLGDFAMGAKAERCQAIFRRLRGRKILVRGNHDRTKTTSLPWHQVHMLATPKIEGQRVTLCHFPMRAWQGSFRGNIHLHGHTHGLLPDTRLSCDVGVDRWNYSPVTLCQIRERLSATDVEPEELRLGREMDAEEED